MLSAGAGMFVPAESPPPYTLRPKIFAIFDFYGSHLTIRVIQNIWENTKIIMIYLKYI
jgi:hypothetical protein